MARLPNLLLLLALPTLFLSACDPGADDGDVGDPDTGIPDAPDPPETTLTTTPAALSNQSPARFEFTADRDATFRCALDGGPEIECTSPHDAPVVDGPHSFAVRAIGAGDLADPTPAEHAWTVDTVAPQTELTVMPPELDNSTTVRFEFTASETASFICALDGGAAAPCTSPHEVADLLDGPHHFTVTAADAAGNVDTSPAARAWMIDTATPDTVIDDGPSGATATPDASFTFSSPDAGAGARFECALDGAAWAACTSPRTLMSLAPSPHTFAVRVIDATGNIDPTPAQRQWTVDTTTPTATIMGPSTPTPDNTPTFTFTLFDAPTTVACRFDTDAFAPCASPYEPAAPLTDGDHVLEVRVADAAGNASTASRAFAVDTVAPEVTIAASPAAINDRTPTFTFTVSADATSAQCGYDGQGFTTCVSPYTRAATLPQGNHVFEVRATDAAGNTGSATRAILIDTTPPTATITGGPAEGSLTNDRTPSFTFSVGGNPTSILCKTTSMMFLVPCDPAVTFETPTPMADGNHSFDVVVTDAAGNQAFTIRSFRVDGTPPTVWIHGPQDGTIVTTRTPSWTIGTENGAVEVACRIDNESFGPCTSFTSFVAPPLADGPHTVQVRARDLIGNEAFDSGEFVVAGPAE